MGPVTLESLSERVENEVERQEKDRTYLRNMLEDLRSALFDFKNDTMIWRERMDPLAIKVEKILETQHKEDILHAKIAGGVKVLQWMVPVVNAVVILVLYYLHRAGLL